MYFLNLRTAAVSEFVLYVDLKDETNKCFHNYCIMLSVKHQQSQKAAKEIPKRNNCWIQNISYQAFKMLLVQPQFQHLHDWSRLCEWCFIMQISNNIFSKYVLVVLKYFSKIPCAFLQFFFVYLFSIFFKNFLHQKILKHFKVFVNFCRIFFIKFSKQQIF